MKPLELGCVSLIIDHNIKQKTAESETVVLVAVSKTLLQQEWDELQEVGIYHLVLTTLITHNIYFFHTKSLTTQKSTHAQESIIHFPFIYNTLLILSYLEHPVQ